MCVLKRCFFAIILTYGNLSFAVIRNENSILNTASRMHTGLSEQAMRSLEFSFEMLNEYDSSHTPQMLIPLSPSALTKKRSIYLGTNSSVCSPWDSCVSRCGRKPHGLPYMCNCDAECVYYSDCCADFEQECKSQVTATATSIPYALTKLTCEVILQMWPLFTISHCSSQWKDANVRKLCHTELNIYCPVHENFTDLQQRKAYEKCLQLSLTHCMENLRMDCDEKIEPQCSELAIIQCGKIATSQCQSCNISFWPVFADDKFLYKNQFCATCNFKKKYNFVTHSELVTAFRTANSANASSDFKFRMCVPYTNDVCQNQTNQNYERLCASYFGPVIASNTHTNSNSILYKNAYCAFCNGKELTDLTCPIWLFSEKDNAPLTYDFFQPNIFEEEISIDAEGRKLDNIPAAFSLLLNFGLDGRGRMLFSSADEQEMKRQQERCGKGFIWDPFSQICRKLYCSAEFILEGFQCVKKEGNGNNITSDDVPSQIPDTRKNFVHLSLSAEVEVFDFVQFHDQDFDDITNSIRNSLANSFGISADRVTNVQFNISLGNFTSLNETLRFVEEMDDSYPIIFNIEFDLHETEKDKAHSEPSVDRIVSMLASALSVDGFEFDINNVKSRIVEIHQTVGFLTTWCKSEDGGEKKEYWNSDFSLILDEETGGRIKGININKTQKFYSKGEFVADILFQGYQFNDNMINVSGLAIVCDYEKKLSSSCVRILLERHEYTILPNGTLMFTNTSLKNNMLDNSNYEKVENGSILVCLSSNATDITNETYYLEFDIIQAYISLVLSCVSVIAMIIVLATYNMFSNLRNLPGCNTMNLTFSLLVMQVTFLLGQRGTVTGTACKIVAHLLHYEILCVFMWMNIMAYDLYNTFGSKNLLNNIRSKKKYLPRYMFYAYGIPLLIIIATILLDNFLSESKFAPHYGQYNVCWITSKQAAVLFFATPLAIIMAINFCYYVMTIREIREVKHIINLTNQKHKKQTNDVFLYARMALVTGLTWALAFAAAYARGNYLTGVILTYLFIIFNTLQGLFIFFVFVCNRRVFELYRGSLHKYMNWFRNVKTSTTTSVVTKIMKRSISTDTVQSDLSNSNSPAYHSDLKSINEIGR